MTRTPGNLAALASSAVSGLDPVAVRAAREFPGNRCDVAFVTDTQRRAWVIRVPTTPAVGAQLDVAVALLGLISRRLPFAVPAPRGFVAVPEGRAMVYPFLHGRSVVLGEVPPGPGVAAEIGRALAALHNVDRGVFDEAGIPVYDAETYRRRHLADLDRAAATGHVPTALLSRWERALEHVSSWRFAPTPTHGDLRGSRLLVSFADEEDQRTASVRAITGWEHAKVADPADDVAALADECTPEAFDSIVEAYSLARIERPDHHLRLRATLAAEMRSLTQLLDAVAASEPWLITRRAAQLRALDERTARKPELVPPPPASAEPAAGTPSLTTGAVATGPGVDAPGSASADDRDAGEDTQLLKVGPTADPTTVIPDDELARLRPMAGDAEATASGGVPGDPGGSEANAGSAADDSWYQIVEPRSEADPALARTESLSDAPSDPMNDAPVDESFEVGVDVGETTQPVLLTPQAGPHVSHQDAVTDDGGKAPGAQAREARSPDAGAAGDDGPGR